MKVYLAVDTGNNPDEILAVFAHKEDAIAFALAFDDNVQVVPRTLFYGQPPNRGYNE